ncbi:MAG: type II toxin-antitoxin system RelE/ParE family toxin [Oscillospiraceae bacterium]|nr:type II toxin-antitoxin system RelE/ParE family toxin [Oscillospiraceae bacterium]
MYDTIFYEDRQGKAPIFDYIKELSRKNDKNSRINLKKIQDYIRILQEYGKTAGEPFIKHIDGDLWELRPTNNRIFFASWTDDGFILLHHFIKKTRKTPPREIEQARRNLNDFRARSEN